MRDQSFIKFFDSRWSRILIGCATYAGPALVIVQIVLYVDQVLNGRLSSMIPETGVLTPLLVSISITSQYALLVMLATREWEYEQRKHAAYLGVLAVPPAVFVFWGQAGYDMHVQNHMTATAVWSLLNFTPPMVAAVVGLFGIYATFVGEVIRREIRRIRTEFSMRKSPRKKSPARK